LRRDNNDWGLPDASTHLFDRGFTGHEHLDKFGIINMNGRLYDPLLGRFLSPDNYMQLPDNSQNFNRYSYCLNNPMLYTDPSGELFGIDDIVLGGILLYSYLGGTAANNGEFNPINWDWKSGNTWAGIGIGAIAGGFGGWALSSGGQALANTAFFSSFENGTIAAYSLTGTIAFGASGYVTGFGTGMIVSNGNWDYANKLGGFYSAIGASVGSIVGITLGYNKQIQESFKQFPLASFERTNINYNPSREQLNTGDRTKIKALQSDQSLFFNGTSLELRQNYYDGSYTNIDSWQAWSGGRNPLPANVKNGRIPNGTWDLININWNQGGSSYIRNNVKFYGDLIPRFSIFGRGGFELHPDGGPYGTNGCIGLQVSKNDLINFYNRANWYINTYGPLKLNVNY
jgi:RHS repeat-associated protein